MQCGCPECGQLLAKRERGLKSECVCQWCGYTCHICNGKDTDAKPAFTKGMAREEYEWLARMRGLLDGDMAPSERNQNG